MKKLPTQTRALTQEIDLELYKTNNKPEQNSNTKFLNRIPFYHHQYS